MAADTGYKEARAISEAAREKDWELPSFGKRLYLGDFQPELISPQPVLSAGPVSDLPLAGTVGRVAPGKHHVRLQQSAEDVDPMVEPRT